jgi:hypothetical protein
MVHNRDLSRAHTQAPLRIRNQVHTQAPLRIRNQVHTQAPLRIRNRLQCQMLSATFKGIPTSAKTVSPTAKTQRLITAIMVEQKAAFGAASAKLPLKYKLNQCPRRRLRGHFC